jgi:hypothetical protein
MTGRPNSSSGGAGPQSDRQQSAYATVPASGYAPPRRALCEAHWNAPQYANAATTTSAKKSCTPAPTTADEHQSP